MPFKQYPYRYFILFMFFLASLASGLCWTIVSGISVPLGNAYDVSQTVISLLPMSFYITFIFVNFLANWVIDCKSLKVGLILGSVITAVGAGIRCLVNFGFWTLILGQFISSVGQPFLLNAPAKITVRWFLVKDVYKHIFRELSL